MSGKSGCVGFSARRYRRTIPSHGIGIEIPTRATIVTKRSDHRPAVIAAIVPTTIPKKSQMRAAPIASENVAGRPRLIWSITFVWLLNDLRTSYSPCRPGKMPFAAFSIIFTYCT